MRSLWRSGRELSSQFTQHPVMGSGQSFQVLLRSSSLQNTKHLASFYLKLKALFVFSYSPINDEKQRIFNCFIEVLSEKARSTFQRRNIHASIDNFSRTYHFLSIRCQRLDLKKLSRLTDYVHTVNNRHCHYAQVNSNSVPIPWKKDTEIKTNFQKPAFNWSTNSSSINLSFIFWD